MIRSWVIAFLLTISVEAVIAAFVAPKSSRARCVRDSVLANVFTHPLATWLWFERLADFTTIECGVLLAELLIYRLITRLTWTRAFLVAFACNAVTAALSFVLD